MMRTPFLLFFAGVLGAVLLFGAGGSVSGAAALPAPTSPSPSDGASVTQPVTLKWSKVTFPARIAGGYLLEFFSGSTQAIWVSDNSYAIPQTLILGQEYQWRVRACFGFAIPPDTESQCGPWSNNGTNWKFTPELAKPKLVSPANTLSAATPAPVTLEWEQVVGADRYNVVLNKTSGSTPFSHTFEALQCSPFGDLDCSSDSSIAYKVSSQWIQLNNSYTWQVVPIQGNTSGPASDLWQFFVALPKPTLLLPEDDDTITIIDRPADISFEWMKVLEAGGYFLQVFRDGSSTNMIEEPWIEGADSVRKLEKGFTQGTYAWQITACEAENVACGPTSERWEFSVVQDRTDPRVESFSAEPNAPDWTKEVTVSWSVSDTGGAHLKQVEVWRAKFVAEGESENDKEKCENGTEDTCVWKQRTEMLKLAPTDPYVDAWSCGSEENSCPTESPDKGIYWYGVHAVDRASHWGKQSRPIKVQVDTTLPVLKANNESSEWFSSREVTLNAGDLGGSELKQARYSWDANEMNGVCSSGGRTYRDGITISVPKGSHRLYLCGRDGAGNVTTWESAPDMYRVDGDAPTIDGFSVEPDVPDWINIKKSTAIISWEVTESGGSGLKYIKIYRAFDSGDGKLQEEEWDSNPIYEKTSGFTSSTEDIGSRSDTFNINTDGIYWYGIQVEDRAGKWRKESRPIKVQVDTLLPSCEFGFYASSGTTNPLRVSFVPNEREKGATYTWKFPDGTTKKGSGLGINYTFATNVYYRVTLSVEDKAGNVAECSESVLPKAAPPAAPGAPGTPPPKAELPTAGPCNLGVDPGSQCAKGYTCKAKEGAPTEGECKKIEVVAGEFSNPLRATTLAAFLDTILNFIFTIALVVVPLVILYASFLFVTGGGNPEQVSKAKKALLWTIIGFLVILLSKGIVFVIQNILGV